MIVDAHLHCSGKETQRDVLRTLDDAGVDRACLLAPFLSDDYKLDDAASLREANAHLGRVVCGAEDRLIGFAVVNPSIEGAYDDLHQAVETHHLRGLKLVPTGWYPYDECAHRVYDAAAELGLPVLFHSGIFIDGRSGRYCRPAFFEAVRDHSGLRVTLAHLGWPWTDEAIAVGLIDRINGVPSDACQFRFDLSFGAPPPYRLEGLDRAIQVLGAELLQFGSDSFLPCDGASIRAARDEVAVLLDRLEVCATDQARIFGGTAAAWIDGGKAT